MTGLPGDTTGSVPTTKKHISVSHTFFGFPMQIFHSQVCNSISKCTLNSLLLKVVSHLDLQWVGILLLVEGLASMLMATDLPVWLLKVGGGSYGNVSKQQSLTTDSSFHDFSVVCNTVWRFTHRTSRSRVSPLKPHCCFWLSCWNSPNPVISTVFTASSPG